MDQVIINEQWRSISGYINYQVSNLGRVRNLTTGKVLKPGCMKSGYRNVILCKDGVKTTRYIHRLVAGEFIDNHHQKDCVDHIDHDRANNSVPNLRWVTEGENHMNATKRANVSSAYKGVYWNKRKEKWHAIIKTNGRQKHIGFYDSDADAALAYNAKAIELFGEYAYINDLG